MSHILISCIKFLYFFKKFYSLCCTSREFFLNVLLAYFKNINYTTVCESTLCTDSYLRFPSSLLCSQVCYRSPYRKYLSQPSYYLHQPTLYFLHQPTLYYIHQSVLYYLHQLVLYYLYQPALHYLQISNLAICSLWIARSVERSSSPVTLSGTHLAKYRPPRLSAISQRLEKLNHFLKM